MSKKQLIIGLIILSFLGIFFYWFQIRPSQIKIKCDTYAMNFCKETHACETMPQLDFVYKRCLRSKGL
jgi:hypothetical protein